MRKYVIVLCLILLGLPVISSAQDGIYLQQPELMIGYVDSCAQFWMNAWDLTYGGFYTEVNRSANEVFGNKNMLTQSRNAYGMVRAYQMTGDTTYLNLAHDAIQWMVLHAWDNTNGGWYAELNAQGQPLNTTNNRSAFDAHYALLGLAAYVEVTRDTTMMSYLMRGYDDLENKFWDDRSGFEGYYDYTAYNGTSPRNKSFNATVDAITTHLLLLQLMTENDAIYLTRLNQLADNVTTHLGGSMPDQAIGFAEEYDSDWNVRASETMTIMGHVLKSSWCMGRIHRLTNNPDHLEMAEILFNDVWDNGYDHDFGGPYKDYNRLTGEMLMWGNPDTAKAWWQMEQGVMAGLELHGLLGSTDPLSMGDETLDFFMEHFVDHTYGDVFENRTRYGDETWGTWKGNGYKAGYHSIETGYYSYLYGSLFVNQEMVTLRYKFDVMDEARFYHLTPIAIADNELVIEEVYHNGEQYTLFDPETRIIELAAGASGEFEVTFRPIPVGVGNGTKISLVPSSLTMAKAYPNPFNGITNLAFQLNTSSTVKMSVYNINGQRVVDLPEQQLAAGSHRLPISMNSIATGTYFVHLATPHEQAVVRVVMVK